MKLKLLFTFCFLLLASCKQQSQTVVISGDSWAAFTCYFKSLDSAIAKFEIKETVVNSTCAVTTRFGMQANSWLASTHHKATLLALKDKSVKVLYLSLGGNDLINFWNKNLTAAEEQVGFDKVYADVESVIREYQKARPDIKILLSGYDFPRFVPNHPVSAYARAFEEMGSPTPIELNSAVVRFSERISKIADQKSIFYIQHYGVMHYYLGNQEMGFEAFKTLVPELISAPNSMGQVGGNPNLLSDTSAMLEIKLTGETVYDAFHLNKFGYEKLAEHSTYHYLNEWLKLK